MKDKLSALGLDGDMIEKVTEILKSEISDKYVPLSRFNEINDAKKKAEEDVASRDAQLETLKNASGDMEKLKKGIELGEIHLSMPLNEGFSDDFRRILARYLINHEEEFMRTFTKHMNSLKRESEIWQTWIQTEEYRIRQEDRHKK